MHVQEGSIMGKIHRLLIEVAEARGWDDYTRLDVVCAFIEAEHTLAEFNAFLELVVAEEDALSGNMIAPFEEDEE